MGIRGQSSFRAPAPSILTTPTLWHGRPGRAEAHTPRTRPRLVVPSPATPFPHPSPFGAPSAVTRPSRRPIGGAGGRPMPQELIAFAELAARGAPA